LNPAPLPASGSNATPTERIQGEDVAEGEMIDVGVTVGVATGVVLL
jgi:hypothetical protein